MAWPQPSFFADLFCALACNVAQVVTGAASLLAASIVKIPKLGAQGGAQLSADVEYFNNVMAALHGQPPASLLTVQLFAGLPAELFEQGAAQADADGGADAGMLRALTAMRGLPLGGASAGSGTA